MKKLRLLSVVVALFYFGNVLATGLPVVDFQGLATGFLSLWKHSKQLTIAQEAVTKEINEAKKLFDDINRWTGTSRNSFSKTSRGIDIFNQTARPLGYDPSLITKQFSDLYNPSNGSYQDKAHLWEKQSDQSINDAMMAQGVIGQSRENIADAEYFVKEKRRAKDEISTLQAIGEIAAIQVKQIANLAQIIASDSRAKQTLAMENRAHHKAQRAYDKHLFKGLSKKSETNPLQKFPSLGTSISSRLP